MRLSRTNKLSYQLNWCSRFELSDDLAECGRGPEVRGQRIVIQVPPPAGLIPFVNGLAERTKRKVSVATECVNLYVRNIVSIRSTETRHAADVLLDLVQQVGSATFMVVQH